MMKNWLALLCCACFIAVATARREVWSCNEFNGNGREALKTCMVQHGEHWKVGKQPYVSWGVDNIASDPDFNQNVLSIFYANGSCSFHKNDTSKGGKGGTYFKPQPFGHGCVDEGGFEYDVKFSDNFQWVIGGKLPGLHGGEGSCSGGLHETTCFSTRMAWRKNGFGEVYGYVNNMPGERWFCEPDEGGTCNTKYNGGGVGNVCNWKYGQSFGRSSFQFVPGQWHRVGQYVKLNDVNPVQSNGYVQIMFDGQQAYRVDGLTFRTDNKMKIDTVSFSTFFGGAHATAASKDDVYTYYKNFVAYVDEPADKALYPPANCAKPL